MTKYNSENGRKNMRLRGYDYSCAGLYFITICVKNRACLFGQIQNKKMQLNEAGRMVETEWIKLSERFKNIRFHEYIVMPNHFHAILEIVVPVGATLVVVHPIVDDHPIKKSTHDNTTILQTKNTGEPEQTIGQPQGIAPTTTNNQNETGTQTKKTLGDMVGAFESITTVNYIHGARTNHWPPFEGKLWQRNYYDHIIRDEQSYQNISEYVFNNPAKWDEDQFNPANKRSE